MKRLDVAIIGCGTLGLNSHLPALMRVPEVRLASVVDKDVDWARKVAERYCIPHFGGNVTDIIGKVDAAVVATPNDMHMQHAILLLQNGVHVLCEKPMAMTSKECDSIIEESVKHSARLMIGHNRRYNKAFKMVNTLIKDGTLGEIKRVEAIDGCRTTYSSRSNYLFNKTKVGGGVLFVQGVHYLDLLKWWNGEYVITGYRDDSNQYDTLEKNACLDVKYISGAVGHVELSWTKELENGFLIEGSRGRVVIKDTWPHLALNLEIFKSKSAGWGSVKLIVSDIDESFVDEHIQFNKYIKYGESGCSALGQDGRKTVELVEECYKRRR